MRRRLPAGPALVVAGWALLLVAWMIGNPPFAAPDEGDHYVRTVGLSSGHLLGRRVTDANIGATRYQVAWTRQATRAVTMPPGLASPADCYVHDPRRSAGCSDAVTVPAVAAEQLTAVGTYQPLPYLLPAVTVRAGDDPREAVRWARLAGAVAALAFLALAVVCIWGPPGDGRPLLGLLTAVTPMALFCGASLTGSGLEIAAGVAFVCTLLRVTRSDPIGGWVWLGLGASGAAFALSRSASPLWVVLAVVMAVALVGPRAAWDRVRHGGPVAWAGAALVALGILANRAWETAYGPEVEFGTAALRLGIERGFEQWGLAAQDLYGKFGYLEYSLPLALPLLWLGLVLGVMVLAWRWAAFRERLLLLAAVTAAVLLPVVLYVLVIRRTGFGLQGRHVLPMVASVPLLAGELVYRRARAVPAALVAGVAAGAAGMHFVAFYLNARRSAVGIDGPLVFLGSADWTPPLGWGAVLGLAAAGALALAAAGWRTR